MSGPSFKTSLEGGVLQAEMSTADRTPTLTAITRGKRYRLVMMHLRWLFTIDQSQKRLLTLFPVPEENRTFYVFTWGGVYRGVRCDER